jgi:hypothetical protein
MPTLFKIELFKHIATESGRDNWSNTYHFRLDADNASVEDPLLLSYAINLLNGERTFHYNVVVFERAVISTWLEDEAGVDEIVRIVPNGSRGILALPADQSLYPLSNVLALSFAPISGRSSIKLYRGCVSYGNASITNGYITLNQNVRQGILDGLYNELNKNGTLQAMVVASMRNGIFKGRSIFSVSILGVRERQRFQKKGAKLSNDGDAITTRMMKAAKELAYILASMRAFDGFKDYKRPAAAQTALAELQKQAAEISEVVITVNPVP